MINLAGRRAVWRLCGSAEGRISGKVLLTAARPNVCATVVLNHCGKIICERSRQPDFGDDRVRVAGRCEAAPRWRVLRSVRVNRSGQFRAMTARTGSGGRHHLPCGTATPAFPHTWPTRNRTPVMVCSGNRTAGVNRSNVATTAALLTKRDQSTLRDPAGPGLAPVRWFHRLGDVAQ